MRVYMKKILPLAAVALLMAACSEKPGYEITGTVANADLNGNYVYLYEYGKPDVMPFDSALVTNNTFSFKGTQDGSMLATISFSSEVVPEQRGQATPFKTAFTLENGKLSITLDSTSVVVGTPANDAEKALKDAVAPFRAEMKKAVEDMRSEDKSIVDAAEKKYDEISDKITEAVCNYILQHTDQKMPAKYLSDYRYQLNEAQQNEIISKADSTFKSVPGIDKLMAHLDVLKTVAVGKKFVDFEMADPKGEMRKLSDYVGNGKNVVLIDFWASWCPPCRKETPHLVELYKQYKNKGFEIVGVSLDSKADAWAKGVKDLKITWPQLSDLKGWQNAGAALYGVNSIPHTVLVDKDGTIIAKNIHGEEIDAKLKEVLK